MSASGVGTAQYELEGLIPQSVETPVDAREVAEALARATAAGHSVVPWGRGASMALGNVPRTYHTALVLRELRGVFDHAPGDLTLTVSAGVSLAELNARLAASGQCLPLDAADPAEITVGGALAVGLAGPRRLGHGTLRDRLLWCQVATPDGQLVESGARVVKSVAGFDLGKLHLGALGSLGVITAACFKLAPIAPEQRIGVAEFSNWDTCARLLTTLRGAALAPTVLTIASEPSSTAGRETGMVYFGAEGTAGGCAFQLAQFKHLGEAAGCRAVTDMGREQASQTWQALMAARRQGTWQLRLGVLPSHVVPLLGQLASLDVPPDHLAAEVENGVVSATWSTAPPEVPPSLAAIQNWMTSFGGTWRIDACPTAWKRAGLDVWGPERRDRALMRAVKQAWDPHHTLAPGRSAGG